MKLKYSLRVGGQDYTDRLLSVSSIDTGVKGLGFGYISDITVECAYDSNLMSAVGQSAEVGLLIEGVSVVYKGEVRKVSVRDGKVSLSISHLTYFIKYPPLKTYYSSSAGRTFKVPVIYGYVGDTFDVKGYAVGVEYEEFYPRRYLLMVGDKPVSNGYVQLSTDVYASKVQIIEEEVWGAKASDWFELIESNASAMYRRYKFNVSYNIENRVLRVYQVTGNMTFYGGKRQEDGTIAYTEICGAGASSGPTICPHEPGTLDQLYDELKVQHNDSASYTSGIWVAEIWKNSLVTPETYFEYTIQGYPVISSPYKPEDVALDIFSRLGISATKEGTFLDIKLMFQSEEGWKRILSKIAEQGVLYYIPSLLGSYRIRTALPTDPPVFTFTSQHILPRSLGVEKSASVFRSLKVIYNQGKSSLTIGTGSPQETYEADFIINGTSAQTFADAYLQYHQKTMKVKFSTPLLPELLNIDVGDVVKVNYGLYGISQNFQVVQRTIRKERIDWVVREL